MNLSGSVAVMKQTDLPLEIEPFAPAPNLGWDELNLCEFPIATLADRPNRDCLSLTFQDTIWDEAAQKRIPRKLEVSSPPNYGLPNGKDEDVLRQMICLTDETSLFADRKVPFTHYRLLRMLGWGDSKADYDRLTEAMYRWGAVKLHYHNAWRDSKTKSWLTEQFSILDNIVIPTAEERARQRRMNDGDCLPPCYFVWNETFFQSMQANYRKRLDLDFVNGLSSRTAKRMYCFLDKRFGTGRKTLEFDLDTFAFEKIGLSRSYDTGKAKEKLTPAITELEDKNYIVKKPKKQRYKKRGPKQWKICVAKAPPKIEPTLSGKDESELLDELVKRGVSARVASDLIQQSELEIVVQQLDVFDWKLLNDPPNHPVGFLVSSIREGYDPPTGYVPKVEREIIADRSKQRKHIEDVRKKLGREGIRLLEQEAERLAQKKDRELLAIPQVRPGHLRKLTDALILARHPL